MSQIKETIGHINKAIQSEELESNNKTTMWKDKDKHTMSAYGIEEEKKNPSTSEKKEKAQDRYDHLYEYGKLFCTSIFEGACVAQENFINKMKEVLDIYKYEIKELHVINWHMQEHIDSFNEESESFAGYP